MCVGPVAKCPPGARGDPAAERRELERLRVEAQRQAVRGELLLEPRAGRAGLDARRARDGVDLEHAVQRAQVDRHRARVRRAGPASTPPTTLVPPPTRHDRDVALAAPVEHARAAPPRRAGGATPSGGCGNSPAQPAHDVEVGAPVRVRRARATTCRSPAGRLDPRRAAARPSASGTGASGSGEPKPEVRRRARPRPRGARPATGCSSSKPQPQCLRRARRHLQSLTQCPTQPGILARGPWKTEQVASRWRDEEYEPAPGRRRPPPTRDRRARATAARRPTTGSPRGSRATRPTTARLELELQPMRWSLRLVARATPPARSPSCASMRDADGRWLAGRRAAWVASWAGRWALGAGGAVEVGEDPVRDARRASSRRSGRSRPSGSRSRRWSRCPTAWSMLIGLAWLPAGARGACRRRARRARLVARRPGAWPDGGRPGAAAHGAVDRSHDHASTATCCATSRSPIRLIYVDAAGRLARLGRHDLVARAAAGPTASAGSCMSLLCIEAVRRRMIPLWLGRHGRRRGRRRPVRRQHRVHRRRACTGRRPGSPSTRYGLRT